MTKPLSLYTGQCLLGASYGLATDQIMFIPASHSVCFFVATPSSAAWISLFFHPPPLWKSLSVYISPFCWFFTTPFFVWLYPVNPGFFYLSLLIYIFQYMDILFLLLSFAFRKNWMLSEHVFVNCYQNFVLFLLLWFGIKKMGGPRASLNKCFPVAINILFSLHKRFLQLSTPPLWKRMHDGVHEQWVWDKFCI